MVKKNNRLHTFLLLIILIIIIVAINSIEVNGGAYDYMLDETPSTFMGRWFQDGDNIGLTLKNMGQLACFNHVEGSSGPPSGSPRVLYDLLYDGNNGKFYILSSNWTGASKTAYAQEDGIACLMANMSVSGNITGVYNALVAAVHDKTVLDAHTTSGSGWDFDGTANGENQSSGIVPPRITIGLSEFSSIKKGRNNPCNR